MERVLTDWQMAKQIADVREPVSTDNPVQYVQEKATKRIFALLKKVKEME